LLNLPGIVDKIDIVRASGGNEQTCDKLNLPIRKFDGPAGTGINRAVSKLANWRAGVILSTFLLYLKFKAETQNCL
jgi:hypothetical protein